jgi:hypothetical protein
MSYISNLFPFLFVHFGTFNHLFVSTKSETQFLWKCIIASFYLFFNAQT